MLLPDSNYLPGPAECNRLDIPAQSDRLFLRVVTAGDRSINNTEYISLYLQIFHAEASFRLKFQKQNCGVKGNKHFRTPVS